MNWGRGSNKSAGSGYCKKGGKVKKSSVLRLSALLVGLPGTTLFAAEDPAIEEVVVTGSYLKRNAADSPSPCP